MNKAVLKDFKVLLLDADGVWFDGLEYRSVMPDGSVILSKRRDHQDGQGLSFLRACGIRVKFISGEGEPLQSVIDKINALPSVQSGAWPPVEGSLGKKTKGDKSAAIEEWLTSVGYTWKDCVYIGDDVNDLLAMQRVSKEGGLAIAPANATRRIKEVANLTLLKRGGQGAIREFAELVLDARGIDEATFPCA